MLSASHLPSQSEALILRLKPHGEGMLASEAISPDWGLITLYWRVKRSTCSATVPDLFDRAECSIKFKQSDKHAFGQEYHLLTRPLEIAAHYEVFLEASRWASFLIANTHHSAEPAQVFALACKVITAFRSGIRPEVVFFKAIFQLAMDEGYPVREDWLQKLSPLDRQAAIELLRTPLNQCRIDKSLVPQVRGSLTRYLVENADFIIANH